MSENGKAWEMRRVEQLRSHMTEEAISLLKSKGQSDPASLTLDEVGILFLVTRERIRELERASKSTGEQT